MTTYDASAVTDSVIAHKKPITLQQGRALRDNPLAISEGAASAPYVQTAWHPYDSAGVAAATGEIWSFAADGAVATIQTPVFADGYEYRLRLQGLSASASTADLRINCYRETSTNWGGVMAILTLGAAAATYSGWIEIQRARQAEEGHLLAAFVSPLGPGVTATFGTTDQILTGLISHASAQKILQAELSLSSGTFDAGAVYLDRRRLYA